MGLAMLRNKGGVLLFWFKTTVDLHVMIFRNNLKVHFKEVSKTLPPQKNTNYQNFHLNFLT